MGEFRDNIYFSPKLENTEFTIYFCNKVVLLYSKSVKSCHFLCCAVKPPMENQRIGKEAFTHVKSRFLLLLLFILAWLMINSKAWALPEKRYYSLQIIVLKHSKLETVLVFWTKKTSAFWCCISWNTEVYGQAKLRGASGNSFIPVVCRRDLQTCAALHPQRISQARTVRGVCKGVRQ